MPVGPTTMPFREKVLSERRRSLENVQEWWDENSTVIYESWTGGAWYDNRKETSGDKETWWWNDEVNGG